MSTSPITSSKQQKATFEAVSAAADALKTRGVTPSVRLVTEQIGGGSPNTIAPLLRRWNAEKPAVEARKSITIDERITDILAEQIIKAVAEATQGANAERDARQNDLETMEQHSNFLERELEETAARNTTLEEVKQQLAGKNQALSDELDQVKNEAGEQVRQARTDAAEAVEKAEGEAAAERSKLDQMARELGVAQEQAAEADRLRLALAKLTTEKEAEHAARIEAEKQLAVAQARVKDVASQVDALAARGKALDEQLAISRTQLGESQVAAAQARAKAEASVALIDNLRDQVNDLKASAAIKAEAATQDPVS